MPGSHIRPTPTNGLHMVTLAVPSELIEIIAERVALLIAPPNTMAPSEPWIGVPEAAAHLGCKRRRIYDLAEQNRIPHRRDGRRLMFRRSELDDWLAGGDAAEATAPRPPG